MKCFDLVFANATPTTIMNKYTQREKKTMLFRYKDEQIVERVIDKKKNGEDKENEGNHIKRN